MPLTKEFLESLKRRREQKELAHREALSKAVGRTKMLHIWFKGYKKNKTK